MTDFEARIAKTNVGRSLQRLAEGLFEHIDTALEPRVELCYTNEEIAECLKTKCEISLYSMGNNLEGKDITVIIHLNTQIYNLHTINKFPLIAIFQSVFVDEARTIIRNIKDKEYLFHQPTTRRVDEILRTCATFFFQKIASDSARAGLSVYYNICNKVSQLSYERKETSGCITITGKDNPDIQYILRLSNPFVCDDIKKLRKVLELTDENLHVISDSYWVYGLGTVIKTGDDSDLTISFEGKNRWRVSQGDNILMVVHDGIPNVYKEKIDKVSFLQNLEKVNNEVIPEQRDKVYTLIKDGVNELHHGGLIVISDNAKVEAMRLGNQGLPIESKKLEPQLIKQFTSIDGAILMDWDCNCYAIGVILDGFADENIGSSTRGSRYNSAARYCNYRNGEGDKVMAIVISEDGMVDVIPKDETI